MSVVTAFPMIFEIPLLLVLPRQTVQLRLGKSSANSRPVDRESPDSIYDTPR